MKFDQLLVLLPCDSLEAFDLRQKEADAEQLLSAWSALWHPRLLACVRAIPRWLPAAAPPQDPAGCLLILPDCSESLLPEDWLAEAEAAGACVLRNRPHRDAMLAAALERLDEPQPPVDPDLAADFLALGFCHFQVELLTRKLRYMSNLDEASLQTAALAAADDALKGDREAARGHLQSAFDRLHEAREYCYPTEARLLDLTLVAETTLGTALQVELTDSISGGADIPVCPENPGLEGRQECLPHPGARCGLPRNLLISGEVIEAMAQREPATLAVLRQALAANRAALIGGEYAEIPLPLLEPEAIQLHLRRGLASYEKHLEQRPVVFGRRRFGLTPVLPQILDRLGFTAALHCTLDDGRFPTGNQSRIQWEGIDGTAIEAIGCLPLDASRAESFFRLAEKLGDAMNLDHTSTVVFAHWPGRSSPWYDDLRRIAAYGSVFGRFLTVTDYFEQTTMAGQRNQYKPDEYRSPYLRQDVTIGRRDPISRWVRYSRRRAALEACEGVKFLADVCDASKEKGEGGRGKGEGRNDECRMMNDELAVAIEDDVSSAFDEQLAESLQKPVVDFARSLGGDAASAERGCLVVNPWSFSQQACLPPSPFPLPPLPPDVPAMGFSWVGPGAESPLPAKRQGWFGRRKAAEPPLAEGNVLRNEFFEVQFDPQTGAIRTISDYHSRDPRLAQQIALRLPHGGNPDAEANYSIMAADELAVTSSGPALGEIQSRGRLLDREGRRVAGFRQTTRAWRGSRILDIQIELDIERQPSPNPWDSYYAARFAWKDETATLHRSVNLANVPTELTQFESPHFVDICRDKQHTTLLLGGLPYHRRFGRRKLDTLLVVHGETARRFRLGIGIDVPHPTSAALGFLSPPLILADQPRPPTSTGWLFHLDCRNVVATHWKPLLTEGRASGFRVRLLETDGRGVRLGLRCFRAVASACQISPGDVPPAELVVEGDRINVPVGPHEWMEVEGRFALP